MTDAPAPAPAPDRGADPIAVVGLGAIFPGRGDTTGFWRDLFEGRDLIGDVPASHWLVEDYYDPDPRTPDRTYGRRGGFLSPVAFDPVAFGLPPKVLEATDSAQLLALVAASRTLADIERDSDGRIDRQRTSVILGVASATELTAHMAGRLQRPAWVNALREAGLGEAEVEDIARRIEAHYAGWQEATFPGLLGNVVAGRIANRLDLGGSNYVTDAACASSLSALQIALHELRAGDSDTVLTGGVDALNDILMYMCFSKTPALSPTGDCRPFSALADGTLLGEGVGMLALRRLSDAERDGNTIHAVIRGLGGASDGRGTAIYSPLPEGQATALRRAYAQAGYGPETVDLIEAHGTGTKAGDKAELDGLHRVFGAGEGDGPWCALGSVKSQIGHTKAAAGAASLIKVVQALSRKVLPPTLKVDEPAAAVRDSAAFYLNTEPRPWVSPPGRPRRASVSSFGFGGSNFHVTLEAYHGPQAVRPWRALPSELFLASAGDAAGLDVALTRLADEAAGPGGFAARAGESQAAFDASAGARAAIVARDGQDLAARASALAETVRLGRLGQQPLKAGVHAAIGAPETGRVAFLFSGQGSQYVGMGAGLAMAFPAARAVWDCAAAHPEAGPLALHRLSFPPAAFDQVEAAAQAERLTEMAHAQPAIAAVALAQLALLRDLGVSPDMTGGHSFGEIVALHAAGVIDAATTLTLAEARGRLMSEAARVSAGAMIAVQAGRAAVQPVLDAVGPELGLANDNAPDQVVLSGPVCAIEAGLEACERAGLKARRLPVATAFHSPIVSAAVEPFRTVVAGAGLAPPLCPVYANATAAPHPADPASLPDAIASQIARPVRFREQVEAMYTAGARVFIEVGPGAVVSGLVSHCLAARPHRVIALDHKRVDGVTQFLSALGALSVAGRPLDLAALFRDAPAEPPPPAPSPHAVMITGTNLAKPYPPKAGAAGRARPNPSRTSPLHRPGAPEETPTAMTNHVDPAAPAAQSHPAGATPASREERMLHELSERHSEYLAATSAAHQAFLAAAGRLLGAAAPAPEPAPIPAAPLAVAPAVSPRTNGHAPGAPLAPPQPVAAPATPNLAPLTPDVSDAAPPDAAALVRGLIAEKTGYPEDMLADDMDLEGELGVDSIKQVEILSAVRERLPELPEIDPERLADLRTISAIAAMIDAALGPAAPNGARAPAPAPAPAAPNGVITADMIRALIAEKTGYPEDMLDADMDLEGELGVDSIKQVEILSALREQHPALPEVEPEALAELRTIRAIADFFA